MISDIKADVTPEEIKKTGLYLIIFQRSIFTKLEKHLLKIGFNKPSFCQNIGNFRFKFINNKC